jgi:carotenoid 1,2-hydratase
MGLLPENEPQQEIADRKLGFDARVPSDGYRWWYLDAFSDDGKAALTIIVFIGSVFSPYYYSARRRNLGNPENFCSVNAILYGPDRRRWALTERGARDLNRGPDHIVIGPSRVEQCGDGRFTFHIHEVCNPWPTRLSGQIELSVPALGEKSFELDPDGLHRWWPAAPAGRVKVTMQRPEISWEGAAYLDCNAGTVPLEQTFRNWHWQRSAPEEGRGHIHYDATLVNGDCRSLGLKYEPDMSCSELAQPGEDTAMAATPLWRAQRRCRTVTGQTRVIQTLEESPFYARSVVELDSGLGPRKVMHESLHLDRFARPWMQWMLPVRMPRRPLLRS